MSPPSTRPSSWPGRAAAPSCSGSRRSIVSDTALPDLACTRTGLAHVHATLLRQDLGRVPAYWLLVGWEYGAYVWDAVLHAGESFGIAPIGLAALHRLRDSGNTSPTHAVGKDRR